MRAAGSLAVRSGAGPALGAVVGGLELVRFYLSEDYARLRGSLSEDSGMTPAPRI